MTNELVQHVAVEESTSIQRVKMCPLPDRYEPRSQSSKEPVFIKETEFENLNHDLTNQFFKISPETHVLQVCKLCNIMQWHAKYSYIQKWWSLDVWVQISQMKYVSMINTFSHSLQVQILVNFSEWNHLFS